MHSLAVDGEYSPILQEQCPSEYSDICEEDVSYSGSVEVLAVYVSHVVPLQLIVWVDPLDGTKEFTEGVNWSKYI